MGLNLALPLSSCVNLDALSLSFLLCVMSADGGNAASSIHKRPALCRGCCDGH